jgi:hypothetical protein
MAGPTKIILSSSAIASQTAPNQWHVRFPEPTASGDTVIVVGQWGTSSDITGTVVDDQGGSLAGGQWVKDKFQADAGHGQGGVYYRRSNCPAGLQSVLVTPSSANAFTQFSGMMCNNLATSSPVDGTPAGGNPTGTLLAAGNITTATTDTFVVCMSFCTSGASLPGMPLFTAASGYKLWASDPTQFSCGMYGIQAAAGTFNPALTSSKSFSGSVTMAVAYKTASSGGGPKSTAQVLSVQRINFNAVTGSPGTTLGPFNVPMQDSVNTVLMAFDDGNQIFDSNPKTHTASNPSNTFDGTTVIHGNGNPAKHATGFVYKVDADFGADPDTFTMTLTVTSSPTQTTNGFTVTIYGLANAEFDTFESGTGTSASTSFPLTISNMLSSALVTAEDNEVIIVQQQEEQETPTNIVASSGTFNNLMEDYDVYAGPDSNHDSGYGVQYADTQGSFNYSTTFSDYESPGLPTAEWTIQAIAFKSKPINPTITDYVDDEFALDGSTATFNITASGTGTLHYQWEADSGGGFTNVGSDSDSYTTSTLSVSDNGTLVKCTVTDDVGSTTSREALLSVEIERKIRQNFIGLRW